VAPWAKEFGDAALSFPRAIVATVRYSSAKGELRTVAFIAPPACAESNEPQRILIAGGRVMFMLPHGFRGLSIAAVKTRWKSPPYPDVAWEDPVSQVVLALRFGEAALEVDRLPEFKAALESSYEASVPGLTWISRALRAGDGLPRLVHHFESDSSRGRLSTVAFSFSFDGKLLSLSVVGPVDAKAAVEQVAVAVRSSLRLE
jgi:hypothetical protein